MLIARAPDADPAAGNPPADPGKKKEEKPAEQPPAPAQDFKAMLAEERRKWEAEIADKERKVKEQADREKAAEEGKWKDVADKDAKARLQAEQERDDARMEARSIGVRDAIRDYFAEHHAAYLADKARPEKYVLPLVQFDLKTSDADLTKAVKEAVEQYVKDNPRGKAVGSVPSGASRGHVPEGQSVPPRRNDKATPTAGVAASSF